MEQESVGAPRGVAGEGQASTIPFPMPSPAPPAHLALSTQEIVPEGRFETWRDLWLKTIEVEVTTPAPERFNGSLEMWEAGPLAIASVLVKNTLYDRTRRLAANGSDDFSFTLCSHSFVINGDKRVRPGGGFFLSHDRRFTVQAFDDCYSCLLKIDRATLLELMPPGFDLHGKVFSPDGWVVPLIRDTVPLLMSRTEPMKPEKREAVGRQIVDLVALLLNPSRDGGAQIERRGLRAARLGAILRSIDTQYINPGLSAETVGRALGLSGRQVNRLLEETTKTFYEHLLERRLQRAHELLTGTARQNSRISEIAAEAGFIDVTHFNHVFRARFGDTPTGLRNAAMKARALSYLRTSVAAS